MMLNLKNGDNYLEVDPNFPSDQVDTLENVFNTNNWEEDTLEVELDALKGDFYE